MKKLAVFVNEKTCLDVGQLLLNDVI